MEISAKYAASVSTRQDGLNQYGNNNLWPEVIRFLLVQFLIVLDGMT